MLTATSSFLIKTADNAQNNLTIGTSLNTSTIIQQIEIPTPQSYSVLLKMPNGSRMPIIEQTTIQQNFAPAIREENLINNGNDKIHCTKSNNKKRNSIKKIKKIETTTLKSIKNALNETNASQANQQQKINTATSPFSYSESINLCSTSSSSQSCSFNSSNDNSNSPPSTNTPISSALQSNANLSNTATSFKSNKTKPGRRSKNQPKEDLNEKKAKSLERNRVITQFKY